MDVPAMNFCAIDGEGNPNASQVYQDALEALFKVSYTLKFMVKKGALQVDYAVFPLEGLWWADDPSDFVTEKKDRWKWTAMIAQPELVTEALVETAMEHVQKKEDLKGLSLMRFVSFHEGEAAQIMHLGPFSSEGPTISHIHASIDDNGWEPVGKHHEIYLSDFRRTAPEKLKTVIRQPFRRKD